MMNKSIVLIASLLALSAGAIENRVALKLSQASDTQQVPTEIVCHLDGCAEVQAKLKVVRSELKCKKADLDACSKARQKLQADLAEAAKQRGLAEVALAKCARE